MRTNLRDLQSNSIEQFQEKQLKQMQKTISSVNILQTTLKQVYDSFNSELSKHHNKKIEKYKIADSYPRMIAKLF